MSSERTAASSPTIGLGRWLAYSVVNLARDARRHWFLAGLLTAIFAWTLARALWGPLVVLPLSINTTRSLPWTLVYVDYFDRTPIRRGDLIVYRFNGPAAADRTPGLRDQPFFKIVAGLPGDAIEVRERWVSVNGQPIGVAKTRTLDGTPLTPVASPAVPPGHVFARGSDADSFDSRYAESGFVRLEHVVAKAKPIF